MQIFIRTLLRGELMATVHEANAFRDRRLVLGLGTSIVSKIAAFVTQILAIPIALKYCGANTYALYLGLVALSLGPSVVLVRFGPDFVARISKLQHLHDSTLLAATFKTALKMTLATCLAALSVAIGVVWFLPLGDYLDRLAETGNVSLQPIVLLVSISIIGGLFATIESVQAGLHETHMLFVRSTISNVISAVFVFVVVPRNPSLLTLICTFQVIPFLTRLVNAIYFISRNWDLLSKTGTSGAPVSSLLADAFAFTVMSGVCAYLAFQAPILYLSAESGALGSLYAISLHLVLQVQGVVLVIVAPVVPALASAYASGDRVVVQRYWRFAVYGVTVVGLLGASTAIVMIASQGDGSMGSWLVSLGAGFLLWANSTETCLRCLLLSSAQRNQRLFVLFAALLKGFAIALCTWATVSMGLAVWTLLAIALCTLGNVISLCAMSKSQYQTAALLNLPTTEEDAE